MTDRFPGRSVIIVAFTLLACQGDDERAEPAPMGALPPIVGRVIGPQPGPDRPLPVIANPFGNDPNALREGRRLFVWYNCAGCHGGHGGGGMGPSLRDAAWIYGHREEDIYNSIAEGRAYGMPAWGTKLPVEQIWKLAGYVNSMGTENEPEPPPPNPVYPSPPPRRDIPGVRAGGEPPVGGS